MPASTHPTSVQIRKTANIVEVKVFGLVLNVLAFALLAIVIRKAWNDIDFNWDSLDYHLPLAAIRTGIVSEKDYRPSPLINAVYGGFPVVPDFLQGWAWKITSHLQAANLVGLAGLLAFAAASARWLRVPFPETVVCLLAVPLILISCTSAYVDLWVNAITGILILVLFRAFVKPEVLGLRDLFIGLAAFTLALNSKLQFLPVATIALAGLAVILWTNRSSLHALRLQWWKLSGPGRLIRVLLAIALIGSGYINTVKNWREFRNPVYPVTVSLGPVHWQGVPEMNDGHEPVYLAHTLEPVKWFLSILEFDAFDGRRPLWGIDAGYLPPSSPGLRMGGYFGAYVGLNLLWFVFLNRSPFRNNGWRPVLFFVVLSLITACLPISHNLRYYSFWMMSLVTINLFLLHEAGDSQNPSLQFRILFTGNALVCLIFVIFSNGAQYVTLTGRTPERLVLGLGVHDKLISMKLRNNERVCVVGRAPFGFMYSPLFSPEIEKSVNYHVIAADYDSQCEGARKVP